MVLPQKAYTKGLTRHVESKETNGRVPAKGNDLERGV